MENKYSVGIWTPWAEVLCLECHGNKFNKGLTIIELSEEDMKKESEPIELKEHYTVTCCGHCGKEIQLNDTVAIPHNIVLDLKKQGYDCNMTQLGGMASGCEITLNEENHYYRITYDFDGEEDFGISHLMYNTEDYEEIWIDEEYYNFNGENRFNEFNEFIEENKYKFKKL